jgi:hypothetical protein
MRMPVLSEVYDLKKIDIDILDELEKDFKGKKELVSKIYGTNSMRGGKGNNKVFQIDFGKVKGIETIKYIVSSKTVRNGLLQNYMLTDDGIKWVKSLIFDKMI